MRKRMWMLMPLILLVVLLSGCDSDVFVRVNTPPVVIKPAPTVVVKPSPTVVVKPKYRYEVDGYFSYDYRNHNIRLTSRPNHARYYEPLTNAKVTVLETGKTVTTNKNGYFYISGVPRGKLTLKVVHNWVGKWDGEYFTIRSY